MRKRTLKLGLVAVAGLAAALPILSSARAYADYAPSGSDVVGVGSDTLQYMVDFLADGDGTGTAGYNNLGNHNKLISFDATADANARLAYGVNGGQSSQTACTPGTGTGSGTGNALSNNTGVPCVLNPTIVLRSLEQPIQRPNGSGAGYKALIQDILNGTHNINFSRASSAQHPPNIIGNCGTSSAPCVDSVTVGTDPLPILAATTTNAVPLSANELDNIYYQPNTGSNPYGGTGCITWNELPGNSSGSTDAIIPIIPQVGSGTRTYFLQQITGSSSPGSLPSTSTGCYQTGEENDPTAISTQVHPADAIEPISQARLDLFLGVNNLGVSDGLPGTGYFDDPSCPYDADTAACDTLTSNTTLSAALTTGTAITALPVNATTANIGANVNLVVSSGSNNQVFKTSAATTTGATSIPVFSATPGFAYPVGSTVKTHPVVIAVSPDVATLATGGNAGDGNPKFNTGTTDTRNLYIYFRASDITSTTSFQPGGSENWLNTLFYDPCLTGETGCQTVGSVTYGPAGQPYVDVNSTPISDAGVTPVDPDAAGNFQSPGA